MKRDNLDETLAALRAEAPSEEEVHGAAKRVFRHVFDSAYVSEHVDRIQGCVDFQALIPSYLERSLAPARVSLLEDHVGQCVDCRRALREAKNGSTVFTPARPRRKSPALLPWALAATLAAGTAIGVTGAFQGLLPGQHAVRATVKSVQGTLYRVSDLGVSLVEVGQVIRNAEELRTAKGSRAVFQLVNGASVEMAERSDVSVSRSWRGTSVDVERGRVIVDTLKSGNKSFMVAAGDLEIPARNAVFAVNHGVKGARVAFAKGSARVQNGAQAVELNAGEQAGSYHLVNASLTSEFAWSGNADHYLSLLNELATLQKQLQAIPAPRLRFSSDLARYLPANTELYAAIPNLGGTLTEAKRLFDERLAESAVLRDWWQRQPASRNGQLDRAFTQIGAISQYLGDEVVISFGSSSARQGARPVFLAALKQSGLRDYLQQNIPAGVDVRFVDAASAPVAAGPNALFVSLENNLLVASPDLTAVKIVTAAIANPAGGGFLQTPFYQRIAQSYNIGAGYLLAIDMEQIALKSVRHAKDVPPGFDNMQYLVLERREVAGDTENRASLSFTGTRQGVASWLAAPGSMGSLDFVSPDANLAISAVMKTPLTIVQELIDSATRNDPHALEGMANLENRLGVKVADDIAAPLGGDVTFAIDGPLLPVPSWKLAVEVYNQERLQNTIRTMVDHLNQQKNSGSVKLQLSAEQVNGRTFYRLQNAKAPAVAAYYTYVEGYLLAGSSEGNLVQAIENRQSGITLASSSAFRDQLPADNYTSFSALVYHNAGKSLASAAEQLKSSRNKGVSLAALLASSGPGLICVYGEPDRIVAATKGSFLGFNLATLAGLQQGKPVLPLIASNTQHLLRQ